MPDILEFELSVEKIAQNSQPLLFPFKGKHYSEIILKHIFLTSHSQVYIFIEKIENYFHINNELLKAVESFLQSGRIIILCKEKPSPNSFFSSFFKKYHSKIDLKQIIDEELVNNISFEGLSRDFIVGDNNNFLLELESKSIFSFNQEEIANLLKLKFERGIGSPVKTRSLSSIKEPQILQNQDNSILEESLY